ncbi:MFS transporter [Burkholderiaceae bacterium DAT-1]|nr:MFS transporter [Burkholderiaceae bacterium DAT-1]
MPFPLIQTEGTQAMTTATMPRTDYRVLSAISATHLLNDMIQSLIVAIYPLIKGTYNLSFAQIGLITLVFQLTASLLQPVVGYITDKQPRPYSLPVGMGFTLVGLVLLSVANTFPLILLAAALVGTGSSIFHPESSRVARMASGGQHGLAQSLFQVGGNAGSAIGPLLAAMFIMPRGQHSILWFSLAALVGMAMLVKISSWYAHHRTGARGKAANAAGMTLPKSQVVRAIGLLLVLIFSKYFYVASISSYLTFYLMHRFGIDARDAQMHLFIFMAAVAVGTVAGGPIGDRIGRRYVIWFSILGVAPFTLLLPYVSLMWTTVLLVLIGVILSSAFGAILVYAQELIPGKVGTVSGLFFGFAFGMGGLGAAVLGKCADVWGIDAVYAVCAFLPLIGICAAWLPNLHTKRAA